MFLNTRIIESKDISLLLTIHIVLNTRNAIVSIKSNITEKWHSVVRPTLKQILLNLKPKERKTLYSLI